MKSKNKYWIDLISPTDPLAGDSAKAPIDKDLTASEDNQWLMNINQQLKQVFQWDQFDQSSARSKLQARLNHPSKQGKVQILHSFWLRAAVIVLAIVSGAFLHSIMNQTAQNTTYTEITVPPGQMTQIQLADGSKVWLNSGSTFKYPGNFDQSTREVYLDGQAFLEVAKNAAKPFVVNTGKFSIQVLGTSFNVTAYADEQTADVTLVEGLVQITSGADHAINKIIPGQSASIENGQLKGVTEVNTNFFTSWKEGKIVFRKETLESIAKKLERWYNVEIRFENDELKKLVYSGTLLKHKPVEQVFRSFILLNQEVDFVSESRSDQKDIIYIKKAKGKREK